MSVAGEDWHPTPIPGFHVSSEGRIASFSKLRGLVILKPWVCPDGYEHVNLNGKRHTVHRLVATAFVPRTTGDVVCHRDGKPANNAATNLRWDTQRGNIRDKHNHGTILRGEAHPNCKYTDAQVAQCRQAFKDGARIRDVAVAAGIPYSAAADIKRGRR